MGKPLDVTLDDDVHEALESYLLREFGGMRAKSLIVNLAVRRFLEQKAVLANPQKKGGQSNLFKE